ncbi:MAG: hemolysin III [Acidimicrobiaceae bacterium]|nr:hemolysin III [Acidimicrobiaceae bacterium]
MHLAPKPVFRGWSHGIALIIAIALSPILIALSSNARLLSILYSMAVIGLFGVSSCYHGFSWSASAHDLLRRIDHSMIFITIAATYTPISWLLLPRSAAITVLIAAWAGAAIGVLIMIFWPKAPQIVLVPIFLIVGWSALLVIHDFLASMSATGFIFLLLGGSFHTIGAVVYGLKKPDPWPNTFGFHEVFHFCVVCGVASHYGVIAFIALPAA